MKVLQLQAAVRQAHKDRASVAKQAAQLERDLISARSEAAEASTLAAKARRSAAAARTRLAEAFDAAAAAGVSLPGLDGSHESSSSTASALAQVRTMRCAKVESVCQVDVAMRPFLMLFCFAAFVLVSVVYNAAVLVDVEQQQ